MTYTTVCLCLCALRTSRMICAIWLIGQVKNLVAPVLFPYALKESTGEKS